METVLYDLMYIASEMHQIVWFVGIAVAWHNTGKLTAEQWHRYIGLRRES